MKYLITSLFISALALPAAFAQSGVGYVNIDRIYSQLPEARAIQSDVNAEFRAETEALERVEADIRYLMNKRARETATTSPADIRSLESQLATKRDDYQSRQTYMQSQMQARLLEKRNAVLSQIQSAADQVRGERGLAMILKSDDVLSASPETDLTDAILQRLTSAMASRPAADNEVYNVVEEMPIFANAGYSGNQDLPKFIHANIRYPQLARDNKIEGMVVIGFIVEKNGSLSDIKVIRSIGGGTDEEALRVARMLTFRPAQHKGKPVRMRMNVPIKFALN